MMRKGPTLSFTMLRMLMAHASRRGFDMQDVCRELGLDPGGEGASEKRVPASAFHAVWREAAARCGDEDFGLHFGEGMQEVSGSHILFLVMMNSPDVQGALAAFCRYHNLLNDSIRPKLTACSEGALLGWDVPGRGAAGRHEAEALLCILSSVFCRVSGNVPLRVMFRHPEPGDAAEHRRVFQAPLMFGQAVDAIVIADQHLRIPLNQADAGLLEVLEGYARKVLHRIYDAQTWADRVREAVSKRMRGASPALGAVASDLALSPRSLQNRLKEEGTTFREELDQVRKETALALLKDPKVTLCDVSFLLGFSEQSSFNHAFRRWTGSTPKERGRARC